MSRSRKVGNKRLDNQQLSEIRQYFANGISIEQLARLYSVSRPTIKTVVKKKVSLEWWFKNIYRNQKKGGRRFAENAQPLRFKKK